MQPTARRRPIGERSPGSEAQSLFVRSQRSEQKSNVLVQWNAQLLSALENILPAHAASEGLVLELLFHAGDLEILQTARRSNQRAGYQESRQFIHAEEGSRHRGIPGHAAVRGMSQNGPLQRLGKAAGGQEANPLRRMSFRWRVLCIGKSFVI